MDFFSRALLEEVVPPSPPTGFFRKSNCLHSKPGSASGRKSKQTQRADAKSTRKTRHRRVRASETNVASVAMHENTECVRDVGSNDKPRRRSEIVTANVLRFT